MSEVILRTNFKREPGVLYFVKSDENGNLMVCKAVMSRGGGRKKKK